MLGLLLERSTPFWPRQSYALRRAACQSKTPGEWEARAQEHILESRAASIGKLEKQREYYAPKRMGRPDAA